MADAPQQPAAAPAPAAAPGQKEDYGDKGAAFIAGKVGIDAKKNRGTIEKITDKIRETIEKVTGKKAPAALSN
ncbi:MAG: hypothetical protein M1824_002415 [Vezdaea acicularis]|nr:MAG: hypothetical protein M1824_002415 [Vezdaea acicularis]